MEHRVLTRYRVMAYVTAVLLIVLVFVGVPLQVAGHPGVATVVGTLHGFLYIIYLFVAFQLTRTLHIPVFRTILVLIAGTVPFGAIIAERKLTSEYARQVRRAARGTRKPHHKRPDPSVATPVPPRPFDRSRWFTTRALVATAVLIVWVPGCAIACWWQVGIGLAGDSLGWIYSVMWPCFALFATVFWWHFVHDDPDTLGRRGLRRLQQAANATDHVADNGQTEPDPRELALAQAEAEDPELAAYNAYLAELARETRPGSWRGR